MLSFIDPADLAFAGLEPNDVKAPASDASSLRLVLSDLSNLLLTDKSIAAFAKKFQAMHRGKKIKSLDPLDKLNETVVKSMLANKDFVACLSDDVFAELVVSSDAAAVFVLTTDFLEARLDALKPGEDCQTFMESCTARALLWFLRDEGFLDESQITRSTELAIYRCIWGMPGKYANPEKIVDVLVQLDVSVTPLQVSARADAMLKTIQKTYDQLDDINDYQFRLNTPEEWETRRQGLSQAFTLFQSATKKCAQKAVDEKEMKFDKRDSVLLVERNQYGLHVFFGRQNVKGTFDVINPGDNTKKTYPTLDQYFVEEENATGFGFILRPKVASGANK